MFKFKAVLALLLVSLSGLASEPLPYWRGYEFREIESLAAIPAEIKQQLGAQEPGLMGLADKGQPFNVTDVVDSSRPMRRFVTAGQDGDTWLVVLEHGGRGHYFRAYLFSAGVRSAVWTLHGFPATLQAVLQQAPKSSPSDEG